MQLYWPSNSVVAKMLKGGALVALIMALLALGASFQVGNRLAGADELGTISGQVTFARTHVNITGGKFKVSSRQREFRIAGHPFWFAYKGKWPNFDAVVEAVTSGAQVTVRYGDCRTVIQVETCDAIGIAVAGSVVAAADEVMGALERQGTIWFVVAALLGVVGLGLFGVYIRFVFLPELA